MYISTYQICVDSPSLAEYVLSVDRTYVPPAAYKPEAINAGHHIRRIMKCVHAGKVAWIMYVQRVSACRSTTDTNRHVVYYCKRTFGSHISHH